MAIKSFTDAQPHTEDLSRADGFKPTREWPDPSSAMLKTNEFNAIWECIKTWDINVPEVNGPGVYSGATGNHVQAILDALQRKGCRFEVPYDPNYFMYN